MERQKCNSPKIKFAVKSIMITYPMFISEGTTEHKLSRIRDCSYLEHAFYSLDKIKDNLFIFGHSLGDEDDHVFYRTNTNPNLKNIFISIFGGIEDDNNKAIIKKITEWEEINIANNHLTKHLIKNYYLYDAESADMWGPQVTPPPSCISPLKTGMVCLSIHLDRGIKND